MLNMSAALTGGFVVSDGERENKMALWFYLS
jgi:hypothetical protein